MSVLEKIDNENFCLIVFTKGITELCLKDNKINDLDISKEKEKNFKRKKPNDGNLLLVGTGDGTNLTKHSREYANKKPMDIKAKE